MARLPWVRSEKGRAQNSAAAASEVAQGASSNTKSRRRWLGSVQIVAIVLAIVMAFMFARQPDDGGGQSLNLTLDTRVRVTVVRPSPTSSAIEVPATGSVRVRNHVALTPQVGGRVVSIAPALRAGGTFEAGAELLAIDERDHELALDQARADIAAATSTLMLQRAEGDAARANYALLNPNKPVPPLVAREPQIAQARAQLSAARARAAIAELNLERTRFALPFAGRVTESSAEVGQVLLAGQPFGRAFAVDAVEVVVPIAPSELARVAPAIGRSAAVIAGGVRHPATVERQAAELDERTRFAELYLRFDDQAAPLPPGTFVDVLIAGQDAHSTFALPTAAEQVNRTVWTVSGGTLQRVAPTTRANTAEGWIVDAFDYNDGIVVGAVPGGAPGLPVEIADSGAGE